MKLFPIRIYQGETAQYTLYFWDVTYDEDGVEVSRAYTDLTSALVTVTVAPKGGGVPLIQKLSSDSSQVQVLDQSDLVNGRGRAVLKFVSTDTDGTVPGVVPGDFEYDAWADLADGRRKPAYDTSPFIVVRTTRSPLP